MLEELGAGQGYLKAGFLGFQKSGKTFTAMCLAIAVWKHFGKKGRLVMYDTEGGSDYLAAMVLRQTGNRLVGKKARSFADLMAVAKDLVADDVLVADSMTHPWRELCASHLAGINRMREKKNLKPRTKLEFQDYGPLKEVWGKWTDFYLNAPCHIIICGRAGFEYEMETNEETNKKDLVKTGVKMKTETEFGFEPSLLVEMERVQILGDKTQIGHRATVIGDRFNVIDGKQFDFRGGLAEARTVDAVFEFFRPHVDLLLPGAHSTIDTDLKTDTGVGEDGDAEWAREKRERAILCEEIQGAITAALPGQSAEEKRKKADLMQAALNTRSWTKIESMDSATLRAGLAEIKRLLAPPDLKQQLTDSLSLTELYAQFARIKAQIGTDAYYRVLGTNGLEKCNQSKDPVKLRAILEEMQQYLPKGQQELVPAGASVTAEDYPG